MSSYKESVPIVVLHVTVSLLFPKKLLCQMYLSSCNPLLFAYCVKYVASASTYQQLIIKCVCLTLLWIGKPPVFPRCIMGQANLPSDPEQKKKAGLENGQMGRSYLIMEQWTARWQQLHLGFSQYGVRSNITGQRSEHDVGGVCPLNFYPSSSFFILCSLIYSGLRWHRGLDSACCQTKALQCSQYYSDPVSALSPMRSPQCYVSLTEKYSHTEKDAILQVEALLY